MQHGGVHLFEQGDLVSDSDGRRAVVSDVSALYATLHWEDGVEEEVEQGDPRIWVEGHGWEYQESWVDEVDTGLRYLVARIEDRHQFWRTAGPKMPEPIHGTIQPQGALLMPWWIVVGALVGCAYGSLTIFALGWVAWLIGRDWWKEHQEKRHAVHAVIEDSGDLATWRKLARKGGY